MKRPFLYLAVSLCLGIVASHLLKPPIIYPFTGSVVVVILGILYSKNKALSHITIYLAIFFFGAASYQNSDILPFEHISNLATDDGVSVSIRGLVTDDPIVETASYGSDRTSFVLKTNAVKRDNVWERSAGLVKVNVYYNNTEDAQVHKEKIVFGDEVVLEGLLVRPNSLRNPGLFDYSKYLEVKGIKTILKVKDGVSIKSVHRTPSNSIKGLAYLLRRGIKDILDAYLTQPHRGFIKAVLIGDRSGLNKSLTDDFLKTGTIHILAISGLHVGLVAMLFLFIFGVLRIPKNASLPATALILIFYSFLAGSNPPIVRATIMFSIFAVGYLMGRTADPLNSLSMAAFFMLIFNPKELFDTGFQLSFLSLLSILTIEPKIYVVSERYTKMMGEGASRIMFYISKSLSVSLAAWVGIAPLVSLYFNIVSPIVVIANMIVIPMLFIIMASSLIFLLSSIFKNGLLYITANILSIFSGALFSINRFLSKTPFAYFRTPQPSVEFFILYYCAIIFLLFFPGLIKIGKMRIYKKHLIIALPLLFNLFVWRDSLGVGEKALKMTFLDVGQGDSVLMEFPGGAKVLIDGGSGDEERFNVGRSIIAPFLWNKGIYRLDAIVATHFHEDHLGGLIYILKNFDVDYLIDNGAEPSGNRLYYEYLNTLKEKKIRRIVVREGDEIMGFDEARIFVLNPEAGKALKDSNDNSIVLKLVYKNSSALLCADITQKAMERLTSYGRFLKSDLLKVPHHGGLLGEDMVVKNFFEKITPQFSVISVGRINRFKAPSKNTLNILTSLGSISYKTMDCGAVTTEITAKYGLNVSSFIRKN